jgi:hypothetical protein
MDILIQLIIDLFSSLSGKSDSDRLKPTPLSPPRTPRRPAAAGPGKTQKINFRRLPPRVIARPEGRFGASAALRSGRVPQPPPLPAPPAAAVPPKKAAPLAPAIRRTPSAAEIGRSIRTRPATLRMMYFFSEVLRPPLAMRRSPDDLP